MDGETGMVVIWFPRLVDKDAKSIDMIVWD